jgi:hypothetical protein
MIAPRPETSPRCGAFLVAYAQTFEPLGGAMKRTILALVVCVCLASTSSAAGVGWIAGVSGGMAKLEDFRLSTTDLEDEQVVWMATGGYQFTPFFGVVGGYADLGDYHAEGTDFGGYVHEISVDGAYLRGVGMFPVTSRFSVLASFGAFYWDYDFRSSDDEDPNRHLTDTGVSPSVGVGVDFDLSGGSPHFRGFNLHAGWERLIKVGDRETVEHENDYDVLLLGITYNFTE